MEGRSHLLFGLAAGVVVDSIFHYSGSPLTATSHVTLSLLTDKAVFYFAIGFGALLPDIDNARSTLGKKLGIISKEIQHIAGHRTIFHSLIGLAIGSLLALGFERVVIYLLSLRGEILPANIIASSHLVFWGVLWGSILHIAADALTIGGVPLLWPMHARFGFPPNSKWRFKTGTWPEKVIVYTLIFLVVFGIYSSVISI
ncbi:MAG TPA: metal-dependent hydrolase [Dictyobacter sp.]|jgi:inner membrane protein|nr:metal-dependent hydrolase [Dictyobacter sp.]